MKQSFRTCSTLRDVVETSTREERYTVMTVYETSVQQRVVQFVVRCTNIRKAGSIYGH